MRLSIEILVVCCFCAIANLNANAQNSAIDSLRLSVLRMPDDTLKVIQLAKISKEYSKNQVDTAVRLGNKALWLAQELDYLYGEAYSYFILGIVYNYSNEYKQAVESLKKAYALFDTLDNKPYQARALNSLGNVYKRKGDLTLATESYIQSLNISKEISDTIVISAVYNNIAGLYGMMGEYDKALEYQMQNLELKRQMNFKHRIPVSLMNIGNTYRAKKNYSMALNYYNQALELSDDIENKHEKSLLLYNIAQVYVETERYDIAKQYYINSVTLAREVGNKEQLARSLKGHGEVLCETGNFKEGEQCLLEGYTLAQEIGSLTMQRSLTSKLQVIYRDQQQYQKSLAYFEIYNELKDSILNIEKMKEIAALEQHYEADKREQQIAFLEKEQQVQELELAKSEAESKQKSFQRNVLVLLLVLTFGVVFYYIRTSKKRKRLNQLLIKQNKKITEQRTEIVKQNDALVESNKTKDRLFQIIAHDLRSPLVSMDSITQLIPYWVEEQDYESLKKLSSTLELSLQNVLSLIDNLLNWALNQQGKFPYSPENLNLKENISEAVEVYKPIAEIKNINLKFSYAKSVVVFADRNMLFTIMRNLLNNAIKFTPENGEIEVGIESNAQFAKVWVKDSGVGIPEAKQEKVFEIANGKEKGTKGEVGKGLGLFFCKEFVNMNNGDIYLESHENKGTTITFTLPLFNIEKN
ncbi:MAG: tetratricopeptide repeat protein [Bacteroidetes bacterium]|nr:tetratricopeptide repeat protein [Bacteroidota bacterium]